MCELARGHDGGVNVRPGKSQAPRPVPAKNPPCGGRCRAFVGGYGGPCGPLSVLREVSVLRASGEGLEARVPFPGIRPNGLRPQLPGNPS